jgi:hypothetical protein
MPAFRLRSRPSAAGHEQAVLGRRVEWLPGLDENTNSRETNPPATGRESINLIHLIHAAFNHH